ncbi:MAG TPA: GNAT family N-acetyltransferase [Actinomycetota bacterium]
MTTPAASDHADRVRLREVVESDLPILFEHQADEEASRVAAFPSRDREAFMAHMERVLADPECVVRTIVADGEVVGDLNCWTADGLRLVGYWIGREFWGRGYATAALAAFLREEPERPLFAHVATTNVGSIRVLEKCGFVPAEAAVQPTEPEDGVAEILMRLDTPPSSKV